MCVYTCMYRAYKSLAHSCMHTVIMAYRKRIFQQNSLSQATCAPIMLAGEVKSNHRFHGEIFSSVLIKVIKASCVLVKPQNFMVKSCEIIIFVGQIIMFISHVP